MRPCAPSRAHLAVKKDLRGKRQQISSLMLRPGRIFPARRCDALRRAGLAERIDGGH
jgi:hypothetical protein